VKGVFTITLGAPATVPSTVTFLLGGTAIINTDYAASSSSTLAFSIGQTSTAVTITPINTGPDGPDYVVLTLIGATGGIQLSQVPTVATVAIQDVDCLLWQPDCVGAAGVVASCAATYFAATTRITTTASSTSHVFPATSVSGANLFYNFAPAPNTSVQWDVFSPGQTVSTANATIARTDLQLPCSLLRQITCTSGACIQITDTQLVPRFFHEESDVNGCSGSFTVNPLPAGLAACTCLTKTYAYAAISPYRTLVNEMIQFIWVRSPNFNMPCAAQAFDGTFYEFFSDSGITYGANGLGTPPALTPSVCSARGQCGSNVELVFVLDEQSTCTSDDWYQINWFARNVINSFVLDASTRFGVVYSGSPESAWPTPTLLSAPVATWENYLGCPSPSCTIETVPTHNQVLGTSTNFATVINLALATFWSGPATGVQRELFTFVCGPDSSLGAEITTMQTNLVAAQVKYWALGVGQGSVNVTTLRSLASVDEYAHYTSVALPLGLPAEQSRANELLCPQTNLCGANCSGLCTCSLPTVFSCSCPTCASPSCATTSCPSPSVGCVASTKICDDSNSCTLDGCSVTCFHLPVNCNDGNACTVDTCNPSTGCAHAPIVCSDGDACTLDSCNPVSGCIYIPISCNDGNVCTTDFCSSTSGCVFTPVFCNDNNVCTADSCVTSVGCTYTPIAGCSLCAVATPPPANACQAVNCIEADSPGAAVTAATAACNVITNYAPGFSAALCAAAVASAPNAYIFLQDISTTLCGLSDLCNSRSCNTTTGTCLSAPVVCPASNPCLTSACSLTTGLCAATPTVCPSPDACTTFTCNNITGCQPTSVLCNDSNPCTVDMCSPQTGCVFTPVVCPSVTSCNSEAGGYVCVSCVYFSSVCVFSLSLSLSLSVCVCVCVCCCCCMCFASADRHFLL
jgi:hypothetical protein